jgi:hypothetical protein
MDTVNMQLQTFEAPPTHETVKCVLCKMGLRRLIGSNEKMHRWCEADRKRQWRRRR